MVLALVATALWAVAGTRPAAAAEPRIAVWKVYQPGWNLVAGPGGSRMGPHGEMLLNLDGTAGGFTQNETALARAGEGYWVFYPQGAMLLLIGTPLDVSEVHVDGGHWATIGNSGSRAASVRGADLVLIYGPEAGFKPASIIQPGEAALVYAATDAEVLLDPFSPPTPATASLSAVAGPPPAFPPAAGIVPAGEQAPASTPMDELNYLIAVSPLIIDVDTKLGQFADGLDLADPSRPSDPIWAALREDASSVAKDLAALQVLGPPPRFAAVHAQLVPAFQDIADGMRNTIEGLLNGQPQRVTLGAGELASGARRLQAAEALLPM